MHDTLHEHHHDELSGELTPKDELVALTHHMIHHSEHHLGDIENYAAKAETLGLSEVAAGFEEVKKLQEQMIEKLSEVYKKLED